MWKSWPKCLLLAGLMCVVVGRGTPLAAQQPEPDLGELDLQDLARIRVTSVARKPEALSNASAAVTVITREDIRRSGAIDLPGVLRLVPGMQVARINTEEWAVSARGFNEVTSNKLLVMIDGRVVYSPLFAGVFWGVQRVDLADVERIEVIRGPGAALWGANAVNGVINIITQAAAETQGLSLEALGGVDQAGATVRYGGLLRPGLSARVYGLGLQENVTQLPGGGKTMDEWRIGQGGFRADWTMAGSDVMTLQGDLYTASGDQRNLIPDSLPPYSRTSTSDHIASGLNLLWRLDHQINDRAGMVAQVYFDRAVTEKQDLYGRVQVNTADADLLYRHQAGSRHDLLWGFGFRLVWDDAEGDLPLQADPPRRTTHLLSAFLQDDIVLVPQRLALTLGSKFEHNSYSGFEYQPNLRLIWNPSLSTAVWGAVSRALRSPSRVDADIRSTAMIVDLPPPTIVRAVGSERFEPEELLAYELGLRSTPHQRLAFELALFYHDYDRLRSVQQRAPFMQDGFQVVPFVVTNWGVGNSYGGEASLTLRINPFWRVRVNYSYLQVKVELRDQAPGGTFPNILPGLNPEHQGMVWSSFDLPGGLELDAIGRYVSPLPDAVPDVPGYVEAWGRLGIRLGGGAVLSLIGQDLLHQRHREFTSPDFSLEQRALQRRVAARLTWTF